MNSPKSPHEPLEPQQHWAHLPENTFAWGIRLLLWVRRHLGAWPLIFCLYPVVLCYWACNARARAASLQYLNRLEEHSHTLGHQASHLDTFKHFIAFAETIMDKLLAISNEPITIQKKGTQGLLDLFEQQRGAIIVTAHIGCLELCRVSAENNSKIRKLNVLVHTAHAQRFNRLLKQLQPNSPVELLQVSEFSTATAVMLAQKIEQGECVAIAGDRVPLGHGLSIPASFLGHEAMFPAGPYILAATLKCPLYAMTCIRAPYLSRKYHYQIQAQCLAEHISLPRKTRQQALMHYAQLYAHWLENQLQSAPLSWFNYFDFWQQGQTNPMPTKTPTA
ncbi:acyltransferase [Lampropedia puyangensis]|uniref:Acyltransferase n=1 Tax=Lampropedia puyangensis TaxID=1330072 RepID=A0A4S8F6S5_9BURK|nr:acyltransferase [Lampropedia puyangensis]THU02581.1 acyltransferase [Lampropedia puyangensis]